MTETIGKAEGSETNGFGHGNVGVGTEKTFDTGVNGEAVFFDFLNGKAEFR